MRGRLACLVLGALLVPALAYADSHIADYYGGGSGGGGGSNLYGFHQSFTGELPKPYQRLGITGDLSVQFGSHAGKDVTQVIYMFGPRFTFWGNEHRVMVHTQFLAGRAYTNDGVAPGSDTVVSVGAALDCALTHILRSANTHFKGWTGRVQVNGIFPQGDGHREKVARVSLGMAYRFPKP